VLEPLSQDRLTDLYRIAIDEYRFEVRLGWDRTTYFLILNGGILTAATGLLKLENSPAVDLFIALLFALGCATSIIGAKSITKSHQYYRRTVVQKTVIENLLGLNDSIPGMTTPLRLAVGTTTGQHDHVQILSNPDEWVARKLRGSAITYWLRLVLVALAIVDVAGAAISAWMMVYGLSTHHSSVFFLVALLRPGFHEPFYPA
jgi:hypothetical protein